jgi:hypothetical protein
VQELRRYVLPALLLVIISMAYFAPGHVAAQSQGKALILSSLERFVPSSYMNQIQGYLTSAGYQVTILKDTAVTINLLTTQLNNYDVIIWRTNIYSWNHITYWYVGELSNTATLQAYAADVQNRLLDNTNGILGISEGFLRSHFPAGSLTHIKLFMLVSSSSFSIALALMRAGVHSVIDYYSTFSLSFDMIDYTSWLIVRYLSSGHSVHDAVQWTIDRFSQARIRDPMDTRYIPSIWYMGDSNLAIRLS